MNKTQNYTKIYTSHIERRWVFCATTVNRVMGFRSLGISHLQLAEAVKKSNCRHSNQNIMMTPKTGCTVFHINAPKSNNSRGQTLLAAWRSTACLLKPTGHFPERNYLQKSNISLCSTGARDKEQSATVPVDRRLGIVLYTLHILYHILNFSWRFIICTLNDCLMRTFSRNVSLSACPAAH